MSNTMIIVPRKVEGDEVRRLLPGARPIIQERFSEYLFFEWPPEAIRGFGTAADSKLLMLQLSSHGRTAAAAATSISLELFNPKYVILIGVAAGLEYESNFGDVIIADRIVDFSESKITEENTAYKPVVYKASDRILSTLDRADVAREWKEVVERDAGLYDAKSAPKVIKATIASSDHIIKNRELTQSIRQFHRKVVAVEMESGGVAKAIEDVSPGTELLVIKGISDLADQDIPRSFDTHRWAIFTATSYLAVILRRASAHSTPSSRREAKEPSAPREHSEEGDDEDRSDDVQRNDNHASDSQDSNDNYGQDLGKGTSLYRGLSLEKPGLYASEYAKALASVLHDASGEVCFGITGHWGRGKTYLARLVESELKEDYQTVWFSAWKHRANPELWAYLYERFRQTISDNPWYKVLPIVMRANIFRHGVSWLLVAIASIAVAFIPLWRFVLVLLGILGVVGVLRAISVYSVARKQLPASVGRMLRLHSHFDKLGLQPLLGEDLKALIAGWTGEFGWSRARRIGSIVSYAVAVAFLAAAAGVGLIDHGSTMATINVDDWISNIPLSISIYPPVWAVVAVISLIVVVASLAPVAVFVVGRSSKSFLLIVDDLDRIPASQILEVIESLKLLLEEERIASHVKVLMVYEEESIHAAILDKYEALLARGETAFERANGYSEKRVVEENLQKLFIGHLRLPPLSAAEQREIMANLISFKEWGTQTRVVLQEEGTQTTQTHEGVEIPAVEANPEPDSVVEEVNRMDEQSAPLPRMAAEPISLSQGEKEALIDAIGLLSGQPSGALAGPRAIESFVTRYKLARLLMTAREENVDPSRLATMLASRLAGIVENDSTPPNDTTRVMQKVIEEVA